MRRSQTYKVEVFDQIPALNEIYRASTALDNALGCRELAPTASEAPYVADPAKPIPRQLSNDRPPRDPPTPADEARVFG